MIYVTNGHVGNFRTGQSEGISLDADYASACGDDPDNNLNKTIGAVGAYFEAADGGRGRALVCGGGSGSDGFPSDTW